MSAEPGANLGDGMLVAYAPQLDAQRRHVLLLDQVSLVPDRLDRDSEQDVLTAQHTVLLG